MDTDQFSIHWKTCFTQFTALMCFNGFLKKLLFTQNFPLIFSFKLNYEPFYQHTTFLTHSLFFLQLISRTLISNLFEWRFCLTVRTFHIIHSHIYCIISKYSIFVSLICKTNWRIRHENTQKCNAAGRTENIPYLYYSNLIYCIYDKQQINKTKYMSIFI